VNRIAWRGVLFEDSNPVPAASELERGVQPSGTSSDDSDIEHELVSTPDRQKCGGGGAQGYQNCPSPTKTRELSIIHALDATRSDG
jgi:hypothetical protein